MMPIAKERTVFPAEYLVTQWQTWTGSKLDSYEEGPIPPEPWPYGPPDAHEDACSLFFGSVFCDCQASDESAN